ncbi:hypothetical protein [Streptomyces thermolilacinus]|uniref:Uncharacterized protein n=1 Tax=Streptomyces thermolilacinus SPC6 TaxID=1306406 RepID=A0A1D3E095_9ACTN|nr:hypothetical protein [Streptomyces thermolilacinus]OEJ98002.1 hypothetical protein J116_011615 [Streptomyces thermolilacinus SPC6]
MAFSADELRVLRRALGHALHPTPLADEDVRDCLRLAQAVDEAARESGRMRSFVLADLARYRAALPGAAPGYLELLRDALTAGYDPGPADLAALRSLRTAPAAAALLARCEELAERSVRARLAGRHVPAPAAAPASTAPAAPAAAARPAVAIPAPAASRTRLLVLQGGRAGEGAEEPRRPQPPKPSAPSPAGRPVPKPSEVFPPRRRPAPPPSEKRVAG